MDGMGWDGCLTLLMSVEWTKVKVIDIAKE